MARGGRAEGPWSSPLDVLTATVPSGIRPRSTADPRLRPIPRLILYSANGLRKEYDRHVREVKSREDALGEATTRHTEADGVYHDAVDTNVAAEKKVLNMRDTYKSRYADPNTRAAKDYKRNLDRENDALKVLVQKRYAVHVPVL